MRAAIRRNYGGTDKISIEEIDVPSPKKDELLIKVAATTVNRTDCANLTAKPFIMRFVLGLIKPRKSILGTDFSGEVLEVGSQVNTFKKGDRVCGFIDTSAESQADYTTVKAKYVFPIPTNINYKEAAASLEGASYAHTSIAKSNIEAGQTILINGATGGIGSALIQFMAQYDVEITATCNTKNIELVKSLGAHKIIDYTKTDFTKSFSDTYDFIFDSVGKSTYGQCKHLLKKKGIYESSELGPYAQNLFFAITTFSTKKVQFPIPGKIKTRVAYILDLLEKGIFKPVIDRAYSLENIAEAYDYVISGEKTGNVLIEMNKMD